MRGFVARLSRDGLGKSSIARKLAAVRTFLKHVVREGRLEHNPAEGVPAPKVAKGLPRDLTVDEMFNLLDRIQENDAASLRDRANHFGISNMTSAWPSSAPGAFH